MNKKVVAIWLMLGFVIFVPGGVMFTLREQMNNSHAQTRTFFVVERSFVMAAIVATVIGLALLEILLRDAGELIYSRIGFLVYLIGAVVMITTEGRNIDTHHIVNAQAVVYVVLALLGQAAFGVAILRSNLLKAWVGWATIIWNIGLLIALPLFSRDDMYYPVAHHVAPLVIGIALLMS